MALRFDNAQNAKKVSEIQRKAFQESNTTPTLIIPVEKIKPNPDNESIYGKEDLDKFIDAIEEDGFTDPVGVYDLGDGTYEIFSGHKRYYSMIKKGEKGIPCNAYPPPKDDIERARRLIRSNSLGKAYTPIMKAREINYFYEHVIVPQNKPGKKRTQLAQEYGMSEANLQKYLNLLDLVPELQELSGTPGFPFSSLSKAKQLDKDKQKELYQRLMQRADNDGELSRTVIMAEIDSLLGVVPDTTAATAKATNTAPIEETAEQNNDLNDTDANEPEVTEEIIFSGSQNPSTEEYGVHREPLRPSPINLGSNLVAPDAIKTTAEEPVRKPVGKTIDNELTKIASDLELASVLMVGENDYVRKYIGKIRTLLDVIENRL